MVANKNVQTHMWDDHISSEYSRVLICKPNTAFLEPAYTTARPVTTFETKMPSEIRLFEANTDQSIKQSWMASLKNNKNRDL